MLLSYEKLQSVSANVPTIQTTESRPVQQLSGTLKRYADNVPSRILYVLPYTATLSGL